MYILRAACSSGERSIVPEVVVVRTPIDRSALGPHSLDGDLVKAVVDVGRGVMSIGGDLHSDEEQALLDDGSRQRDLWGINLYLSRHLADWIEFDSMINLRPSQGNRSRGVDDPVARDRIVAVVQSLVRG